jgi:hypothetical protein
MPSQFHHRTIVLLYNLNIVFTPSVYTIVPSRFHHRAFVDSPSYHRCFAILQSLFHVLSSCFHHRTIAFSSSYHRAIPLLLLYHHEWDFVCFNLRLQVQTKTFLELEKIELIVTLFASCRTNATAVLRKTNVIHYKYGPTRLHSGVRA